MHRFLKKHGQFRIVAVVALVAAVLTPPANAEPLSLAPVAPLIAPTPRIAVRDLGPLARNTSVAVTVALNYRNASELEGFIEAASDPRSPEYGQFLTPAQFSAAFAPTLADYDRVAATLLRAGFSITRTSPTRTTISAAAPAAIVAAFFHTQLRAVQQPHVAGPRYTNATPAYVPAGLRDLTYGVAGLNNLVVAKPQHVRASSRRVDLALGPPIQGPDTGLSPFALATAYDFPVQHALSGGKPGQTIDGKGHAAGISIDADLVDSDLAAFLAYFNIKRTGSLVRVAVDGGSLYPFDGDETTLDAETIAGLAPGANIYLYLIPDLSDKSILDDYAKVVEDDKVDVLNSSYGGCEVGDTLAQLADHIAVQGAAEGITFSASSGDSGADICLGVTPTGLGVSAPASAPHFTAVGGTSLIVRSSGAYQLEVAWNGSGGGISTFFPTPTYQKGVKNVLARARNLPDLSFDANPGTGASFYYLGAFQGPIGGTSLSSPTFCALVTELNETSGKRSGEINTALYALFKNSPYGVHFRDIIYGSNAYFGPGYSALPGYDDVTGIGSMIGTANAK